MIKIKYFLILPLFIFSTIAYSAGPGALESHQTLIKEEKKRATNFSKGLAHFQKATKYEKKNKLSKAEQYYQKSIKFFFLYFREYVGTPEIFLFLGIAHGKIKKLDDAKIYFSIGLDIDPDNISLNEYLGSLYVSTNELDLAKKRLEKLKKCDCSEFENLNKIINGLEKSYFIF